MVSKTEEILRSWKLLKLRRCTGKTFKGVKGKDGNKYFAHTLNNTVVAPPRMLIAFLENNLNEDGSVNIPKALQPYMGGIEKIVPKH